MNVSIIGSGYVGLVTAACFADLGHNVTCVDINRKKINSLKKSVIPFYEPGLKEIVQKNFKSGFLNFTSSYKVGCKNAEVFFICVDTPDDGSGNPNLKNLNKVIQSLAKNINTDSIVVTKSTVPLGTNRYIANQFAEIIKNKNIAIDICSNPEFLKEGSAVQDFMRPDRIIVGTDSDYVKSVMNVLYERLNRQSNKLIYMSIPSAELSKYAANAFLATKISFVNELSHIAEKTDANMHEIRYGMGSDPRIGGQFLYAGLGYGGSCFPKDVAALLSAQKQLGLRQGILKETIRVNQLQLDFFLKKIYKKYKKNLSNKIFTIWGLSFKPDTDDLREAVALRLIKKLAPQVKRLNLYDPICNKLAEIELKDIKNIKFYQDKYKAFNKSDALVICTEWKEFWNIDYDRLRCLNDSVVFDGRNFLDKDVLNKEQIEYIGIGI